MSAEEVPAPPAEGGDEDEAARLAAEQEAEKKRLEAEAKAKKLAEPRRIELKVMDNEKGGSCILITEEGKEYQMAGSIKRILSEAMSMNPGDIKLAKKSGDMIQGLAEKDRAPSTVLVKGVQKLPKGVMLSKAQAIGLQQALYVKYMAEPFQIARRKVGEMPEGKERTKAMKDLTFAEQKDVLEKYGYEATTAGAINMTMFFMYCYFNDQDIQNMNNALNDLLGTPSPNMGQAAAPPAKAPVAAPQAAAPAPKAAPRAAPSTSFWKVLNEEKGSLLAREGKDIATPECGRLLTGAYVAQLSLEGERLQFQKVKGFEGPETGWVSLTVKGEKKLKSAGALWTVATLEKGLLTREGKDLTSPEAGRLASGALLEELSLEGERLNFQKLLGEGPATGWVSLSVKGKDMVQRY